MLLVGQQFCAGNALHQAVGICEICRKPYCKRCSVDLEILDQEIQLRLKSLLLGSLPHIVCGGCFELMTILYGESLQGALSSADIGEELLPIWTELDRLILHPERADDHRHVLSAIRKLELIRFSNGLSRIGASRKEPAVYIYI